MKYFGETNMKCRLCTALSALILSAESGIVLAVFKLNLNVDSDDWVGSTDMTYSGPVVSLIANW